MKHESTLHKSGLYIYTYKLRGYISIYIYIYIYCIYTSFSVIFNTALIWFQVKQCALKFLSSSHLQDIKWTFFKRWSNEKQPHHVCIVSCCLVDPEVNLPIKKKAPIKTQWHLWGSNAELLKHNKNSHVLQGVVSFIVCHTCSWVWGVISGLNLNKLLRVFHHKAINTQHGGWGIEKDNPLQKSGSHTNNLYSATVLPVG